MKKLILSIMFSLLATVAMAQEPTRYPGLGDGDTTPGTPSLPQDIELTIAAGVAVTPEYIGSDDYHAIFDPAVKFEYKQQAFLVINRQAMMVPYEGLGVKLLSGQDYSMGLNLTYDGGREDDVSPIRGIGDQDWTALGGVFAAYHPGNFFVRGNVGYDVLNEYSSYKGELGFGLTHAFNPYWRGMIELDTAFGGEDFAKSYFGINSVQATNSGLAVYNADGGFYRLGLSGTLRYNVTQGAFVSGLVRMDQLMNDGEDSPISKDDTNFTLGTNIGYQF